jgi:hypothetical protein
VVFPCGCTLNTVKPLQLAERHLKVIEEKRTPTARWIHKHLINELLARRQSAVPREPRPDLTYAELREIPPEPTPITWLDRLWLTDPDYGGPIHFARELEPTRKRDPKISGAMHVAFLDWELDYLRWVAAWGELVKMSAWFEALRQAVVEVEQLELQQARASDPEGDRTAIIDRYAPLAEGLGKNQYGIWLQWRSRNPEPAKRIHFKARAHYKAAREHAREQAKLLERELGPRWETKTPEQRRKDVLQWDERREGRNERASDGD